MVNELNPYATLGLMPGSAAAEVKRRYRQLAKQYHPDSNGQKAGSEEKLRDLNAAYALLSDPVRKAACDSSLAAIFAPAPLRPFLPQRRRVSARAATGFAVLALLSTGIGVLFTAANSRSPLTGVFAQTSDMPRRPAPVYLFVPVHHTFDDQNSPGEPASAALP